MDEDELFLIAVALGGAMIGCTLAALVMIFFY
jgi:hypothetical protein